MDISFALFLSKVDITVFLSGLIFKTYFISLNTA